jgi:hypothetical protein
MATESCAPAPYPLIEPRIFVIRGAKVLLDSDLARLYEVETRTLNQAVRRNPDRFPEDFMFRLTTQEANTLEDLNLRSQTVISSYGGRRHLPYVFTEQGVAMLSSVLASRRAIVVNIAIMRTFVRLRQFLATQEEIVSRLDEFERHQTGHDSLLHEHTQQFEAVFATLDQFSQPPPEPSNTRRIGFPTADENPVHSPAKKSKSH